MRTRFAPVVTTLLTAGLLLPALVTGSEGASNSTGDQATLVPADALATEPVTPAAAEEFLPYYLKDRGTGVALSMFGSYIRKRELVVYPYWEYYRDSNREYTPEEFGFAGQQDFRGRFRESEWLFFLAYGITDGLAIQAEVAGARASLEKSPTDGSLMPPKLEASGLTTFETQLRWRWKKEDEGRPELWSYLDVGYPTNEGEPLIGTVGWEAELGVGLTRGFKWGTLTARVSGAYEGASTTKFDLGEYAVEYLKRVSPSCRLFAAVQGHGDEVSLITEAQWHLTRRVFIRFNQEVGLSSRATDWEPQLGILFTLPTGRSRR